jgi:hypothetical protein
MQRGQRRCAVCGTSIAGYRSDAVCCGGACRARASRLRHRLEAARPTGPTSTPAPGSDPHRGARDAHGQALKRINARFRLVPVADRPDVNGPEWLMHDEAIEAAFAADDRDAVIGAVEAWERFAFEELTPGTDS